MSTRLPGGVLFSTNGSRIADVYIRSDGFADTEDDKWDEWFVIRTNLSPTNINNRNPAVGVVYFRSLAKALEWAKRIERMGVRW